MEKLGFLLLAIVPIVVHAEDKCPWINAATAAGMLGGAVKSTVSRTACEFVRQDTSSEWALRIEVETMSAPGEFVSRAAHCGSVAEALTAIGNEAVACTYSGKKGQTAEQVLGRVRNQAFLVRVSTSDGSGAAKEMREKARNIAEQVAGFLF